MNPRSLALFAAAGPWLAACTTGPAIAPVNGQPNVYLISRESPTQYPPADQVRAEALLEAAEFCKARGGEAVSLDEQASKQWNITGNVPTFRMRFRCAARPMADAPR